MSRITILAAIVKNKMVTEVLSRSDNPKCPVKECQGKIVELEAEPTDLGQHQFECFKCHKLFFGMSAESVSKNIKVSGRELSMWRVRVKSQGYKGFDRLKLTTDETRMVQEIKAGRAFLA